MQLAESIQTWAANSPCEGVARLAEDRLSWTLTLKINVKPPLEEEWNHLFGEAVHHLRASLDNMVVSIARQAGVSEPKIRQMQFPISGTRDAWKKDGSRIKHLPPEFKATIEAVQPFQRGDTEDALRSDLLLVLRDLDNQDKHHIQVSPMVQPESINHQGAVEFESEADAKVSIPPDTEVFAAPFRDGEMLLRWRTKHRIAKVKGQFGVAGQVQVVLPDGRREGLTQILEALCYYTKQVMEYVAATQPQMAQERD
jgi:hypothetical protein